MLIAGPSMINPTKPHRRRRRFSKFRRSVRRRWADIVVGTVFVFACLVALLLLLDVIDTTIAKPERPGAVSPRSNR